MEASRLTPENRPRHHFLAHGSEWELVIEANTAEALFEEAALALMQRLSASQTLPKGPCEELTITAVDLPALLAQWLNELLFRVEARHLLYGDFKVLSLQKNQLQVRMCSQPLPAGFRNPVKAATYHRLSLKPSHPGFIATVVLDV